MSSRRWHPTWKPPTRAPGPNGAALDATQQAAHTKADRQMVMLGLNWLLAVVLCCAFGLYFFKAIGIEGPSDGVDAFMSALVIAGGTKKLHDFMSLLQRPSNPSTSTEAKKETAT